MLPFSAERFYAVFADYNAAIWPAQIAAYGIGLIAILGMLRPGSRSAQVVAAALALMWLFTGVAYQLLHFTRINPAAFAFGAAFVMQAGVLMYAGSAGRIRFGLPTRRVPLAMGVALMLYASVLYPLIGALAHGYPEIPLFGVTPCPVTMFTLGCLLLTVRPVPWWVLAIPVLWSVIGGTAAFLLGVPQDWALLASGPATALVLAGRQTRSMGVRLKLSATAATRRDEHRHR